MTGSVPAPPVDANGIDSLAGFQDTGSLGVEFLNHQVTVTWAFAEDGQAAGFPAVKCYNSSIMQQGSACCSRSIFAGVVNLGIAKVT
jgi:hypothetical protein